MAKSKSLTSAEEVKINKIKTDIIKKVKQAGTNGLTINQAAIIFKAALDKSIKIAGARGKESLIRSQEPIKIFHEVIKQELVKNGVKPELIIPILGQSYGEIPLYGYFKDKAQDICVMPNTNIAAVPQKLTSGLLHGRIDPNGHSLTESIISINVRSQMSSIAKNVDTMFERIFAEPLNLHMRCSKLVMGEFYIIPTTGYDFEQVKLNKPKFCSKIVVKRGKKAKTTAEVIEEYILAFQSVNKRNAKKQEHYKYEKVCLLIVDFTAKPIKIYQTNQQLKRDKLLPKGSIADLSELSFKTFVKDLLKVYATRFGTGRFK